MPDTKWKPNNAPNIKEDFERKKFNKVPSNVVSKLELERLLAERDKPIAVPRLTRGGTTEQYIHEKHSQMREKRIDTIEQRLEAFKNRLKNEFNCKRHQQERIRSR